MEILYEEEEVVNVFGPINVAPLVTILPPEIAARPRGSVGRALDHRFMRESGASAKPEPKARLTAEPARAALEPTRANVPPPSLSEVRWIMGSDLPEFHDEARKQSDKDWK